MKILLIVGLVVIAGQAQGQKPLSSPVADATRSWLQQEGQELIAAAERMPADKYGFQPTLQQMTFAHLMTHIVETNRYMCSSLAAVALPQSSGVNDDAAKNVIVEDVKASFDYCTRVLANVDDSRLDDLVPVFNRTRANLMIFLAADHADHYATAAIYLRLNHLVPPTAQATK